MQPMGRKQIRFYWDAAFKPPKGLVRWWQNSTRTVNKTAARMTAKKAIRNEIADLPGWRNR